MQYIEVSDLHPIHGWGERERVVGSDEAWSGAVSSLEMYPLTRDRKILEDSATTLQLRPQSSRCRESLRGVSRPLLARIFGQIRCQFCQKRTTGNMYYFIQTKSSQSNSDHMFGLHGNCHFAFDDFPGKVHFPWCPCSCQGPQCRSSRWIWSRSWSQTQSLEKKIQTRTSPFPIWVLNTAQHLKPSLSIASVSKPWVKVLL